MRQKDYIVVEHDYFFISDSCSGQIKCEEAFFRWKSIRSDERRYICVKIVSASSREIDGRELRFRTEFGRFAVGVEK